MESTLVLTLIAVAFASLTIYARSVDKNTTENLYQVAHNLGESLRRVVGKINNVDRKMRRFKKAWYAENAIVNARIAEQEQKTQQTHENAAALVAELQQTEERLQVVVAEQAEKVQQTEERLQALLQTQAQKMQKMDEIMRERFEEQTTWNASNNMLSCALEKTSVVKECTDGVYASFAWLRDHTKMCPKCNALIQCQAGVTHPKCGCCDTSFSWDSQLPLDYDSYQSVLTACVKPLMQSMTDKLVKQLVDGTSRRGNKSTVVTRIVRNLNDRYSDKILLTTVMEAPSGHSLAGQDDTTLFEYPTQDDLETRMGGMPNAGWSMIYNGQIVSKAKVVDGHYSHNLDVVNQLSTNGVVFLFL